MARNISKTKNKELAGLRKKRIIINCILVVLLLVSVVAYEVIRRASDAFNDVDNEDSKIDANKNPDEFYQTEPDDDGYWNILIMGLDARADDAVTDNSTNNYGDKRSDCMILVSINRETKEVKLVSFYRDTVMKMRDINYFENKEYCYSKATHAYSWGSANILPSTANYPKEEQVDAGPYYTIDMLQRNLDIYIDNFVTVDFGVVAEVIDILGGVTITLTEDEVYWIDDYIHEINSITGGNAEAYLSAGTQKLNGIQATAYARIRYTAGDDYKRTERQRDVLMLTAEKAKKASITQLFDILEVVAPSIRTNLTDSEIETLILKYATNFKLDMENNSRGFPFEKMTKSGDSYVYPDDLASNVIELHKYLYNDYDYEVSVSVQNISDYIASMYNYGQSTTPSDEDHTWYDPDDETPAPTEEPVEEPTYTEEPEGTEEPTYTEIPVQTDAPTTTDIPVQTDAPTTTDIPVPTAEPTVAPTPKVTVAPTDVPIPEETPEVTVEPMGEEAGV